MRSGYPWLLGFALSACMAPTWAEAPDSVLATLNIEANDSKGDQRRSVVLMDVQRQHSWRFPLRSIQGGPIEGQPMHTIISNDKKEIYMTVGGNKDLPLRVVTLAVDWSGPSPSISVARVTKVLDANTVTQQPSQAALCGASASAPVPPATQEGHGPNLSPDGRLLMFSEMNNNRLRVLDTRSGQLVGQPTTHPTLKSPHGVYPNPGFDRAATTQYELGGNQVALWHIDAASGALRFDRAVTLSDGSVRCAVTHTVAWINDTQFYTGCTQEASQGIKNAAQQSVWLVDAARGRAQVVLGPEQILEGVSDVAIAGDKLYVAEGNIFKEGVPPGHVSIWDISHRMRPAFIKRLSANRGLPAAFGDAHELEVSADGRYVFAQSFRSGYLLKIDSRRDKVAQVWGAEQGMYMPHGFSSR